MTMKASEWPKMCEGRPNESWCCFNPEMLKGTRIVDKAHVKVLGPAQPRDAPEKPSILQVNTGHFYFSHLLLSILSCLSMHVGI